MRQPRPVRGHPVEALDGADRDGVFVGPGITHDADALHRQQHGKTLPQSLVPSGAPDLLRHDLVRQAKQFEPLPRNLADQAYGQAGPRERLPHDELAIEAEVDADAPHFVLEQIAQRLDQLEIHPLRQAPHVVMTLDHDGWTANRRRFDHVRIERSLPEMTEPAQFVGARLEHIDERAADNLALLLRIRDTGQPIEEQVGRVDEIERQTKFLGETLADLFRLVVPQQAVVDEDAGETVADGAMDQHCRYRRVDATREPADHLAG